MNDVTSELRKQYSRALQRYLSGDGESALLRAYELGRAAVGDGVGLLDMVAIGYTASLQEVMRTLSLRITDKNKDWKMEETRNFLIESLSAFELTHRSHTEANMALRHLNQTVEEEIKRVAYTLHDDASQMLAAVYLALGECARAPAEQVGDHLKRIRTLLDHVGEQLRRLSHELHPSILDDFGLMAALQFIADGLSKRSGLAISIKGELVERLPSNIEIVLYRIVQESLANVIKHAQATRAVVIVDHTDNTLTCRVKDNGNGFDVEGVLNGSAKRGLGLRGIQERVQTTGGALNISSKKGEGSELEAVIPLLSKKKYRAKSHDDPGIVS